MSILDIYDFQPADFVCHKKTPFASQALQMT